MTGVSFGSAPCDFRKHKIYSLTAYVLFIIALIYIRCTEPELPVLFVFIFFLYIYVDMHIYCFCTVHCSLNYTSGVYIVMLSGLAIL